MVGDNGRRALHDRHPVGVCRRGDEDGAIDEFVDVPGIFDQADLAVGRCDHDAGTARWGPGRVSEERGAGTGRGQPGGRDQVGHQRPDAERQRRQPHPPERARDRAPGVERARHRHRQRRGADGQVRTDTYVYESPSLNPEFENQPAVDGPIDPPEIENRTSDTIDRTGPENDSRIPVSGLLRPGAENPPPAGDLVTPEPQQTRDTTASTPPLPSAESPAPDTPAPGSPVPVHQPPDTPPPEDRTAIEEIPTKNFPLPPAAENDDPAAEPTQGSKLPRTPSRSTSRGLRAQGRSPRQIADAEARELARTQGLADWAHALASTEGVTLEVVDARLESEVKQNRCTPAEADKVRAITVELGVASEPEAVVLSPADALKAARHELRKSREAAEAQRAADEAPDPQPSLFDGEPVETGDYL